MAQFPRHLRERAWIVDGGEGPLGSSPSIQRLPSAGSVVTQKFSSATARESPSSPRRVAVVHSRAPRTLLCSGITTLCRICPSDSSLRFARRAMSRKNSAWRSLTLSTSPLTSSRSSAYSRIVSNIRKRSSGRAFTRLASTSASTESNVPSATFSAPSSVNVANTASRAKSRCSSGARRSSLHSIVARSVRCRSGASRRPPGQERQATIKPLEQRLRAKGAKTRGRELERKRQAVEPSADLSRGFIRHEVRPYRTRSLRQQLDCIPLRQSVKRVLDLALDPQGSTARRDYLELRCGGEHRCDHRRRVEYVLKVVHDEQHVPVA